MSRRLPLFTTRLLAFAVLALSLGFARTPVASAASGITEFEAHCSDSGIVVHFTYVEDPLQPTGHPEWTQFALRRGSSYEPLPFCGTGYGEGTLAYIPRTGATQSVTYIDHPEPWNVTDYFDYSVVPLTAEYQSIYNLFAGFDRSGCPLETAPAVMGMIEDLGWAVRTVPCPGFGCGGLALIKEPWASQLRPYAGTDQAFLFYGEVNCGTTWEGGVACNITLQRFEPFACPATPVPTRKGSWGQLKVMYR
jgi:hypothetical protein